MTKLASFYGSSESKFDLNYCFDQICSPNQENVQYQYRACDRVNFDRKPHNIDCPAASGRCGTLLMTLLNHGFDVFHGSVPIVKMEHITSVRVNGPGCFVLYENQNYRKPPMMKVYEGLTFSTNISVIRSIQYWYDCQGSYEDKGRIQPGRTNVFRRAPFPNITKRYIAGIGSILAVIFLIVALFPSFRESYKLKQQVRSEVQEMSSTSALTKNKKYETKRIGIDYRSLLDEVACWRIHFSWPGAITNMIFGLVPSAWDVSSDYFYAQTWDSNGHNPQIRALVYFFISLPHLMTILNAVNSWITRLFRFPSARTSLKFLSRSMGFLLYLAFLAGFTYGALQLGVHHPDVFAVLAIPSAAMTVLIKMAGVIVQGPEAKRALALLTAR